jgi:hypothetical protein
MSKAFSFLLSPMFSHLSQAKIVRGTWRAMFTYHITQCCEVLSSFQREADRLTLFSQAIALSLDTVRCDS